MTDGGCQIPAPLRICHCSAIRISLTLAVHSRSEHFLILAQTTAGSVARDRSPDIAANMLVIRSRRAQESAGTLPECEIFGVDAKAVCPPSPISVLAILAQI